MIFYRKGFPRSFNLGGNGKTNVLHKNYLKVEVDERKPQQEKKQKQHIFLELGGDTPFNIKPLIFFYLWFIF
ncbi:MAG: hypothetical protein CR988_01530 [Treponema sp.]|nr:MAG: hypothetical protein CR988_01530 [Treponema sp.]